jgi:hypothetical protein
MRSIPQRRALVKHMGISLRRWGIPLRVVISLSNHPKPQPRRVDPNLDLSYNGVAGSKGVVEGSVFR